MLKPILKRRINSVGAEGDESSSDNDQENSGDGGFKRPRVLRARRKVITTGKGNLQCTVTSTSLPEKLEGINPMGTGVITSIAGNLYDHLERIYHERRTEVISKDGFIATPLHVMKSLSEEWNTSFHAEVFVLSCEGEQVVRVEIFIRNFRGIGQSPRRKLSFQMAAADILEKMVFMNNMKLQPYALLPGFRTNPSIYKVLIAFCKKLHLQFPEFKLVEERPYEQGPMYVVECQVGCLKIQGESDSRFLAKRLAAKKMYEKLSAEVFRDDFVLMGSECFGLKELREKGIIDFSKWKTEWLRSNRIVEKKLVVTSDEPDDGDLGDEEDSVEFQTLTSPPALEELRKIKRVVINDSPDVSDCDY